MKSCDTCELFVAGPDYCIAIDMKVDPLCDEHCDMYAEVSDKTDDKSE